MNLEPEKGGKKAAVPAKQALWNAAKALPLRVWKAVSHNLLWKLLAVFLAISLWAGLITQDPTLTRERVFSDVQVPFTGSETLRRNGLIILADFENEPLSVRLRADVPQREFNTVSASNYSPRIDLSRITQTGKQTLRILTSSSTTYGTVREITPESIEVIVDEYVTNYRVPVSVERSGQYPKGFYGVSPTSDPASVTVSGPKSLVDQIARVIVDFDVSQLTAQTGLARKILPMRFADVNGDPIESSLIEVTSAGVLLRSIIVEQTLYATKTLPLSSLSLISGVPAEGYEVKSVTATPNILVAAGDETALGALDALFLDKAVDVTGQSESFSTEVEVRQPSELIYLSTKTVMLSIEIGPVISARTFDNLKVELIDRIGGRTVTSSLEAVSVTLTGPVTLLNDLKPAMLTAYADVTELSAGSHELPILLHIEGTDPQSFTYGITPKLVKLRIVNN